MYRYGLEKIEFVALVELDFVEIFIYHMAYPKSFVVEGLREKVAQDEDLVVGGHHVLEKRNCFFQISNVRGLYVFDSKPYRYLKSAEIFTIDANFDSFYLRESFYNVFANLTSPHQTPFLATSLPVASRINAGQTDTTAELSKKIRIVWFLSHRILKMIKDAGYFYQY